MKNTILDGNKGTSGRLIKVNHAGEFGAINIYRAQILLAHFSAPSLIPKLRHFLSHEKEHLQIFGHVLAARGIPRCRSYWLCGIGGYALGLITALLGRPGIMACTASVESVVTAHLQEQMEFMRTAGDMEAYNAVQSILADELQHQQEGVLESRQSWLYQPINAVVSTATKTVIWLGLHL